MIREYHCWHSPRLQRDMELLIFGHGGSKMLIFPTRCGRFFDYENWGLVETLRRPIEQGRLQLFCVDSLDAESLYAQHLPPWQRLARHKDYEEYLLNEVLPLMDFKNPDNPTIAHGCSLGAFHAANIAFRHPHLFQQMLGFSGRYDLRLHTPHFRDLLDGFYNDEVYFNTPPHFLSQIQSSPQLQHLQQMRILLVVGQTDEFASNNRQLSEILNYQGLRHEFYLWQGEAHKPHYWQQMLRHYLRY